MSVKDEHLKHKMTPCHQYVANPEIKLPNKTNLTLQNHNTPAFPAEQSKKVATVSGRMQSLHTF